MALTTTQGMHWPELEKAIAELLGGGFRLQRRLPIGGGCIHENWRLDSTKGRFFLKCNRPELAPAFDAEWLGLTTLAAADAVRVPEPVAKGIDGGVSWLLLEYIPMGSGTPASARQLGEQLAALHHHCAGAHGSHPDNFIGASPQSNASQADWAVFFRDQRLGKQWHMARDRGAPSAMLAAVERVMSATESLFAGHRPDASLLHGDLWGGNWGTDENGLPVLFDPAVYYGDRETDLAMTELFGGFTEAFYAAYRHNWPLAPGYERRRPLYHLYHVLNHFNLFGGAYAGQAERLCSELL